MYCKNCGKPINKNQAICLECGIKVGHGNSHCNNCGKSVEAQQTVCLNCGYSIKNTPNIETSWPIRDKFIAGILGIIFGGIGLHKFYLKKPGLGIIYLLFCWTFIPSLIGFIEGILYLLMDDIEFQNKYHVRLH